MVRLRGSLVVFAALAVAAGLAAPTPAHTQGIESEFGDENSEAPEQDPESTAVEPVWLGVQIADESADRSGAVVREVIDDSPAARAGLQPDDRIVAAGDREVEDLSSLRAALSPRGPGDQIELKVRGGNETQTKTATLSARPTESALMRRQLVGTSLPAVAFEDLDGERVDPADHRGKPLVLEFWATWCRPCRITQKRLRDLDEQFGDTIAILGVSSEKRPLLRTYRRQTDLPYPIVRDPDESAKQKLLVSRYPTLVVVDSEGTIAEVFVGTDHADELNSAIKEMVETDEADSSDEE